MARVDVLMPQMGESIAEGTVSKWLKKLGDPVKRDEPLFEISTDKVDAEVPSPTAGVLAESKVQEGQTVPVQTLVAVLETGKAAAAAAAPAPAPSRPAPPPHVGACDELLRGGLHARGRAAPQAQGGVRRARREPHLPRLHHQGVRREPARPPRRERGRVG